MCFIFAVRLFILDTFSQPSQNLKPSILYSILIVNISAQVDFRLIFLSSLKDRDVIRDAT